MGRRAYFDAIRKTDPYFRLKKFNLLYFAFQLYERIGAGYLATMQNLELHDLEFVLVPDLRESKTPCLEQYNVLLDEKLICTTIDTGMGWILVNTLTGESFRIEDQNVLEDHILVIANSFKKGAPKCLTPLLS